MFIKAALALLAACLSLSLTSPARAADGDYFIVFMARPTVPISQQQIGHIFFCLEVHLSQGVKEDCFGFYPSDLSLPNLFGGPGVIKNEFSTGSFSNVSISQRHELSADGRKAVLAALPGYTGAGYNLSTNNCIDFIYQVAAAAGVRMPDRSSVTLPTTALEGMRDLYWRGSWQSDDAGGRFNLRIDATAARWTETNGSGAKLAVDVAFAPSEAPRLDRANTAQVLAHLGFQPALTNEILAAGPKPSYLVLSRIDNRLDAEWYGLVATKTPQGKLDQLKQPGMTPAKPYRFKFIP